MIGTVLSNRYKLVAELGSGGMAWVYLAEDLLEKQQVAVKVLYPQHSQDLGFLQRFIREAKLSMSLSQCSPQRNVVCVLDYGADRDTHYLVMEYVQGRDLWEILRKDGPLLWQNALNIARQVALALDHAYQMDIVHRDIKPSNIMILADGTVRVLDFGIARARTSPELTITGFVGSPHYAAPEQATGEKVDVRADIYSLGIVLYRMLSGQLPFQGDTPWQVVNQQISATPPPLSECCPNVPQPVVYLVEKAMAKRPQDRFQTPMEMVEAIDAVLKGHELPFEPVSLVASQAAATLEKLYGRAEKAVEAERWQVAVDLFSQILKIDPGYRDVSEQLSNVGFQIRLDTLYRTAQRALQAGHWDRALEQLEQIEKLDPDYKDIKELRTKAENKEKLVLEGTSPVAEFPTQVPTEDDAIPPPVAAQGSGPVAPGTPPPVPPTAAQSPSRRRWLWVGILFIALVAAIAAYAIVFGPGQPVATPVAVVQPSPTLTSRPTGTPTATLTPTPTPTPLPPSPTPSATPTTTPTATTSPTASPTATPTVNNTSTPRTLLSGQIAFPRFDPARGTYDVYSCHVDGTSCKRVVAEASQPALLPNGSQVVVHSWKADDKGLILYSATGALVWRITDQIEAARPSVDFQGKIYAYHSRQEADRQPRLYRTYDAENRPIVREASIVLGQSPAWLPDGRILYTGCLGDSCGIIVTRADGTSPRQVVAGGNELNAEASPNGRQVAFMSQRSGNWEIYTANLDGGSLRRLTNDPADDGLPVWSPDGRYIAFVSNRDGEWAVWVMLSNGSQQRKLFDVGGPLDGRVRNAAPHEIHGWLEERISWGPLP